MIRHFEACSKFSWEKKLYFFKMNKYWISFLVVFTTLTLELLVYS